MRVVTVAIIVRGLTLGGVTRFIRAILHEFEKNRRGLSLVIVTDNVKLREQFPGLRFVVIKSLHRLTWDYFTSLTALRNLKPDAIIYPKSAIPLTHEKLSAKKFLVVHDLAYFEDRLGAYKWADTVYMRTVLPRSLKVADCILSVSHATKQDIVNRFGIKSEKVTVVDEAIEEGFNRILSDDVFATLRKKYAIKEPFFFYCGSLSPRKNQLRFLQAFEQVKDRMPHHVYYASGKSWKDKEVHAYIDQRLSDRVSRLGYLDEEELRAMYRLADLYIYPSLYEGFGLPILEAQSCGCPVMTSRLTSCPEVAGDAALYVDAKDVQDIAGCLLKFVENPSVREELIVKGYQNVKRYSWKKTADRILEAVGGEFDRTTQPLTSETLQKN